MVNPVFSGGQRSSSVSKVGGGPGGEAVDFSGSRTENRNVTIADIEMWKPIQF